MSRIAGLLAVAVLPAAAGLAGAGGRLNLASGFGRAMVISGVLAALGGVLAWVTIRTAAPVESVTRVPAVSCDAPGVREAPAA